MPEEDKVPLVVEGHDATTLDLGVMWEQGRQHPGDRVTEPRVEIGEDHFRLVRGRLSTPLKQEHNHVLPRATCVCVSGDGVPQPVVGLF